MIRFLAGLVAGLLLALAAWAQAGQADQRSREIECDLAPMSQGCM